MRQEARRGLGRCWSERLGLPTVRKSPPPLRETWDIRYATSPGRTGIALFERFGRDGLAGTVKTLTAIPAPEGAAWSVVACIALDDGVEVFARIEADVPWTPETFASKVWIGSRVREAGEGRPQTMADVRFVPAGLP
jgi:hypothetical protein